MHILLPQSRELRSQSYIIQQYNITLEKYPGSGDGEMVNLSFDAVIEDEDIFIQRLKRFNMSLPNRPMSEDEIALQFIPWDIGCNITSWDTDRKRVYKTDNIGFEIRYNEDGKTFMLRVWKLQKLKEKHDNNINQSSSL